MNRESPSQTARVNSHVPYGTSYWLSGVPRNQHDGGSNRTGCVFILQDLGVTIKIYEVNVHDKGT